MWSDIQQNIKKESTQQSDELHPQNVDGDNIVFCQYLLKKAITKKDKSREMRVAKKMENTEISENNYLYAFYGKR